MVAPDVLYDSAKSWLQESGINLESVTEAALVHIPIYQFYYNFNNQSYTAIVEASSGLVYANIYPAKSETPFRVLFAMSIAGYIVTSIICFIIAFAISDGGEEAFVTGEMLKVFAYALVSVPLVIMAYIIAKKV